MSLNILNISQQQTDVQLEPFHYKGYKNVNKNLNYQGNGTQGIQRKKDDQN